MREIKFRSWCNRENKMSIPDSIANGIDGDKYQIMQYTGLKDKNGKEIYEWDIVKASWHWDVPTVIEYPSCWYDINEYCLEDELEVIGNIYENPELIKEVK